MNNWAAQLNSNIQVYFAVLEPLIDWLCAGQALTVLDAGCFTMDALPPFTPAQADFVTYHLQRSLERDEGPYGPFLDEADRHVVQQLLDRLALIMF